MRRLFVIVMFALVGCSPSTNNDAGTDVATDAPAAPTCEILGERCHGSTTTVGMECHELGHNGTEAMCVARQAECIAACPEHGDGGHHGDSGSDAAHD